MRGHAPALLPVFRSQLQGRMLARLATDPDRKWSVAELATELGAPATTVLGEVLRLRDAHLLVDHVQGRNRLIEMDVDHPAYVTLRNLALSSFGPEWVIGEEFANISGAQRVLIFGSWAARFAGEPGRPPNDIDVLVIGDTARRAVFDAARRAEVRLGGVEVNAMRIMQEIWDEPIDNYVVIEIQGRPSLTVWGKGSGVQLGERRRHRSATCR